MTATEVYFIAHNKEIIWEENTLEDEEDRKEGYAMEHEILETPSVLHRLAAYTTVQQIELPVTILGCGSSYNASLLAKVMAEKYEVQVELASEAVMTAPTMIAVSQSGETADVLETVEKAKETGTNIIAVVNTPHSTLTRVAHNTYPIHAGEERCVASTKSFTLQLVMLTKILGKDILDDALLGAQEAIIDRAEIRELATQLYNAEHVFIIGRQLHYPLAMEFALKLKEICYQHAEAVPALELKHGPLALITEQTPVIVLGSLHDTRLASTMHEIEARGGTVIPFYLGSTPKDIVKTLVAAQLLTLEIGKLRETPIDFPRNLAKSVTVF